ncbi:MAG: FtsQ-type POTRA domain-containing protein [Candidatus Eisenbacteria bacterium]|nr:FtsQ-type POTRA domain-containing protein [Candidatus Eisenbacteria bacterium]
MLDLLDLHAGDPWWRFRPAAIRSRAASSPAIQSLSLRYVWFHRLRVELTEREGSLAVLSPIVGEMSEDGWLLPPSPLGEEHDLPILRARGFALPAPGSMVGGEIGRVARLVGEMRRTHADLWREISEIDLGPEEARAFLRSGRQIVLFTPGRHDDLWGKVPTVLEDLRRQGRHDVVLDLRFPERIVVHLPEVVAPDTLLTQTGKERA